MAAEEAEKNIPISATGLTANPSASTADAEKATSPVAPQVDSKADTNTTTATPSDEANAEPETSTTPEETPSATTKPPPSPLQSLWLEAQAHSHHEVWGVTLEDPATHVPSQVVFQKYLNANDGDLSKAKDQLKSTLDNREKNDPTALIQKHFAKDKFGGLGYVTSYSTSDSATPDTKEVFTWNIYGGVKDIQASFGDLDAFIEWRVALMEMAMHELDLASATKPITADDDPYKIYQVHDYKSISFLRSPPAVRTAARKTVEVLAMAYPETLREKFFVNVPAIMGFMYGLMKLFVAPKTIKKFHPMSNGGALHLEFAGSKVPGLGEMLPNEYGGKGGELSAVGKELLLQ